VAAKRQCRTCHHAGKFVGCKRLLSTLQWETLVSRRIWPNMMQWLQVYRSKRPSEGPSCHGRVLIIDARAFAFHLTRAYVAHERRTDVPRGSVSALARRLLFTRHIIHRSPYAYRTADNITSSHNTIKCKASKRNNRSKHHGKHGYSRQGCSSNGI